MDKTIRVYRIRAKMLQHTPDYAFTGGNVAGKTDDIFSRPVAHDRSLLFIAMHIYFNVFSRNVHLLLSISQIHIWMFMTGYPE
jgi:hypothetical protein